VLGRSSSPDRGFQCDQHWLAARRGRALNQERCSARVTDAEGRGNVCQSVAAAEAAYALREVVRAVVFHGVDGGARWRVAREAEVEDEAAVLDRASVHYRGLGDADEDDVGNADLRDGVVALRVGAARRDAAAGGA